MTSMPSFTCPACSATSHHPEDVAQRYCGRCHWWTGDPKLASERPELFTAHGVQPSPSPFTRTCDAVSLHAWDPEGDEDRRAGQFGQEYDRQSTAGRDSVEMRTSEVTAMSPVHVVVWSGDTAVAWMEPVWLGRPGIDTLTVEGPFGMAVA